jgi:hypothetical protein
MRSETLDESLIATQDCVVMLTDQPGFDCELVLRRAKPRASLAPSCPGLDNEHRFLRRGPDFTERVRTPDTCSDAQMSGLRRCGCGPLPVDRGRAGVGRSIEVGNSLVLWLDLHRAVFLGWARTCLGIEGEIRCFSEDARSA